MGPDLQNILRESCDYLTTVPKLRRTANLNMKHLTKDAGLFFGDTIHLQTRKPEIRDPGTTC